MKPLIWATLLAAGAAGAASPECARTSREHYVSGWEQADSVERIGKRITADGVIECSFLPDPDQRLNVLTRYEQGILDGAGYRVYYSDGSGLIQAHGALPPGGGGGDGWRMSCEHEGGDRYRCTLARGDLRVHKDTRGETSISVGDDPRAGSELLVRVDRNWAVTAPAASGFSAAQTRTLLAQMRAGAKADIGFHRTSLQGATEIPLSLAGFNPAMEIMDRVLEQLKTAPRQP